MWRVSLDNSWIFREEEKGKERIGERKRGEEGMKEMGRGDTRNGKDRGKGRNTDGDFFYFLLFLLIRGYGYSSV